MNSLMCRESWLLVENFSTVLHFYGFTHSELCDLDFGWFLIKSFSTFRGFLPMWSFRLRVLVSCWRLSYTPAFIQTGLSDVDSLMHSEFCRLLLGLLTFSPLVEDACTILCAVGASSIAKGIVIFSTFVRFLSFLNSLMCTKSSDSWKRAFPHSVCT